MIQALPESLRLEEEARYQELLTPENFQFVRRLIMEQVQNGVDADEILERVGREIYQAVRRPNWRQPEKPKAYLKTIVGHTCTDYFRRLQRDAQRREVFNPEAHAHIGNEIVGYGARTETGSGYGPQLSGGSAGDDPARAQYDANDPDKKRTKRARRARRPLFDPRSPFEEAVFTGEEPLSPGVETAMNALPEKLRKVVWLKTQQPELAFRDIANQTGISGKDPAAAARKRYERGIDLLKEQLSASAPQTAE